MSDVVYLRVSGSDQSLRSQLPDLQAWARANNPDAHFVEDHATGTSMDRPGWSRVWKDCLAGKVKRLIVWRLDRLGRTAAGLCTLLDDLQRLDIGFVSLKEGIDLHTPAGRLLAVILAGVAAYEIEVRKERQTAGIAAAKRQGKRWGGSRPGRTHTLTPAIRRQVQAMDEQGIPRRQIARALSISPSSVYEILAAR